MDRTTNERQERERAFYAQYSRRYASAPIDLDPVDPKTPARPWNPYWYCHRRLLDFHSQGAKRLLDFGCGWGDVAIRAAHVGFEVHGFDITPENVAIAQARAEREGVAHRTHFTVGTAERLHYAPDTFDVIIGIDILHHVDIPAAIPGCRRILRAGGHILFKEPVRAPVFDTLRDTRPVRAMFPTEMSLNNHLTEDERKLDRNDLRVIGESFPGVRLQPFRLLARAQRILPFDKTLQKIDMVLLRHLRPLRALAGFVVIEGQKVP